MGIVEERVDRALGNLGFQEIDREEILALFAFLQPALDPDLNEEDFGDLVEGGGGVEMLVVSDDVVALVEQVGKFLALERLPRVFR